jgi:Redoxin
MSWLALLTLGTILHPSVALRDIDGILREPLKLEKGHVEALFFVTNDCPVSNYYSHEIRRICDDYAERGVGCALVYTDPSLTDEQARQHAKEYGHGAYPKIVDRSHALVKATGAVITPTAVLVRPDASIAYRGRIDNSYAAIGKQRRVVTEHDLRDALNAVIAGKPVAKQEASPVGCYIQN